MRSHLIFLPAQCDRPTLTIRDGMSDVYYRSIVEIARRIGADAWHVESQIRFMLHNGEVERMAGPPGQVFVIGQFRLSTSWRLDVPARDRRGPRPGSVYTPRRRSSRTDAGGSLAGPLMLTADACPELRDDRVTQFLTEGVEHD